ncbi:MAG: winged helix-turn-helix transcriptional regulator, partial [Candidatus Methanoplasma sp.]|jgi:ATP-dependent DNA helicase RecG|nr:winged helix-turn-helix transcriptional regulator [Candidatus Methanoplasma sp.]
MLSNDGKVSYSAAILFSPKPRRVNDGAFLKIGQFNSRRLIQREDYVESPLIMVPDDALSVLYDKYVPPVFGFKGASRILVYKYPLEAVRELIVNALCHMDYEFQEPVTVSVFPDKMEISCLGELPKGWVPDDLKSPHRSVRRNKTIANVFHAAGYVENWAQGIGKVMEECRKNGNPEPEFSLVVGGLVVAMFPKEAAESDEANDKHPVVERELTDVQGQLLEILRAETAITSVVLAEKTGVSARVVKYNLAKLAERNLIVREGSRKNGRWKVL